MSFCISFESDEDFKAFYEELCRRLNIDGAFRFTRFNVKMVMTHLLCTVTAYNKHLNVPMTAEGLFAGTSFLKKPPHKLWGLALVDGRGSAELDVSSFADYVAVIQSQGIQERNFNLKKIWSGVFVDYEPEEKMKKFAKLFFQTQAKLQRLESDLQRKNKSRKVPYTACCVSYLQTSACL